MNNRQIGEDTRLCRVVAPLSRRWARGTMAFLMAMGIVLFPRSEAYAAVAFGAAGAVATGTTSLNVPHPAGIVAGDLLVLVVGNKFSPANPPTTPAGWTLVGQGAGGLGNTNTNDQGPVFSTIFVKEAVGGEAGNLAVSLPLANSSVGRMFRYTKAAGTVWDYAATSGSDDIANTAWSVTGAANPGIMAGDMLIVGSATNTDQYAYSAESVAATGATFGIHTERQDSGNASGRDVRLVVSDHTVTAGVATAAPVFTMTASGTALNRPTGASVILRVREVQTTVLGTGSDPAAATIGPGAAATDVDQFTLQTSGGTEAITSVTVNLSTNSGVGRLAITDNAGAELGFTTSPVAGSNTITVSGMLATTALTTFKVRVTPLSHAAMPAVPGASYAITAPVTSWVGPNTHAGSDTNPNALTIDNLSPSSATATSGAAGEVQVTLNWTASASADLAASNGSLVYRWAAASAGAEVPVEGSAPALGSTNGTATVACLVSSAASTALVRIDGSGGSAECTAGALTKDQTYAYKVFQQDASGNFDAGFAIGSFTPTYPTVVSINRAGASPISAATVVWTVTFSSSVTGVDATDFALAATGISGAFITTVSGSGTSWTVTANTGIGSGSGTLGLNLVDDDTIVDASGRKLGATGANNGNFTGEVYSITATPALAEYRMDEALWSGTAGEVADSSGSGNHAQAFNSASTDNVSPALTGTPGTCRYGVFDNGTTITQGYVQTPLPDLTTDFTIAAWVRTTNNAITGQRILIDDNNNTTGYGFSLGDGAAGRLRFFSRGITPIIFDSTYTLASNTWYFVAAVSDIANKRRTIHVFDAAGTLLNTATEAVAWTGTWGADAGPVSIGAETNTSAELPATYHFRGNLDEVRVYQKVLNPAALAAIAAERHACITAPDHFEIQSTGTGVTCTPSTLTVVACADAPCNPYTLGVSGTLSAAGTPTVNWDGTTGGAAGAGFVIPIGSSSVTKDVQVTTPGSVVFGVASATPAPTNPATCNFGVPSCTFTAADTGFLMSAPGHVAETASTLTVQAVKKADNSLVCVPAFANAARTVNLKCSYVNPASGTLPARVGGAALNAANNAAAACDAGGANISLNFDASGIATPSLYYADVGVVQIDASYAGAGLEAGLSMTGAATFIAAPASFALTADAGPVKAGNPFSATVTALNALDNATPNFGKESAAEGVTLGHALAMGAGSWIDPALGGTTTIPGASFTGGAATASDLTWPEVGQITLNAVLASGSYLGSGLTASGTSATDTVFIPDHYDTEILSASGVPMGCGSGLTCPTNLLGASGMVYSEQPFGVKVYARTLSGATTANYHDAYAQNVTLSGVGAGGTLSNPLLSAAVFVTSGADAGTATTVLPPVYSFGGVTETAPTDIFVHAQGSGVSAAIASSGSGESGVKVVSGRARFGNAYGSEKIPLTVPLGAQFWNGTDWLDSTTDNASQINTALSTSGGNLVVSGLAVTVNSPGVKTLSGGVLSSLVLNAPGVPGVADLTLNGPAWLTQFQVGGQVTFGIYQGNRSIIYQREAY